jgi:hypothetical protein
MIPLSVFLRVVPKASSHQPGAQPVSGKRSGLVFFLLSGNVTDGSQCHHQGSSQSQEERDAADGF